MRVGIEGKLLTPRAGGIGRYSINLIRALLTRADRDDLEFVIFTGPQTSAEALKGLEDKFLECRCRVKSSLVRSLISVPVGIAREGIELFHGLDHVGVPLLSAKGKYLATVHDILPVQFPRLFKTKHRLVVGAALRRVISRAARIIVPSHAVEESVLRHFAVPEHKLAVIPEGCEERFGPEPDPSKLAEVRRKYGLPSRYILFLGTLEPRKNLVNLLAAYARAKAAGSFDPEVRLVVAGAPGWRCRPVFQAVAELGLGDSVVFPGFIDDADLPDVYRGAALFVYPSLHEGFGLPILEAMGCGVPVLCSNTSSMPEVAGDAAILIDPRDPQQMGDALLQLLQDDPRRQALKDKGIRRARGFTWQATARSTLALYRELGSP